MPEQLKYIKVSYIGSLLILLPLNDKIKFIIKIFVGYSSSSFYNMFIFG